MRLLVCATGRSLWEDLKRLGPWDGDWMAVNYTGFLWKRHWDHWATMHPEVFPHMAMLRDRRRDNATLRPVQDYEAHAHKPDETGMVEVTVWPFRYMNSGCFAARVGLELEYDEIVLAGCPHDEPGHFFNPDGPSYLERNGPSNWHEIAAMAGGRIRSMSGWTRELFA